MKKNEQNEGLTLEELFDLPIEWVKALYSIEYCLTQNSINIERNSEKKLEKQKWLQNWERGVLAQFKKVDENFSLICDNLALCEYLGVVKRSSQQKSHAYLVVIESLFFVPYSPLDTSNTIAFEMGKTILNYRLDIDFLSSFTREIGVDKELLNRFKRRFANSSLALSGKMATMAIIGVASGIVIAVTAGIAAPAVALLFAAEGLTGAAAISSGLAALGGGAIAAGGTGMLGGIVVLVTSGGILGVTGGATVAALVAQSPQLALLMASKLEVYFREVLLPILKDTNLAKKLLREQELFIQQLNTKLESGHVPSGDKEKYIRNLKKAIEILQKALNRNRKALIDYNH